MKLHMKQGHGDVECPQCKITLSIAELKIHLKNTKCRPNYSEQKQKLKDKRKERKAEVQRRNEERVNDEPAETEKQSEGLEESNAEPKEQMEEKLEFESNSNTSEINITTVEKIVPTFTAKEELILFFIIHHLFGDFCTNQILYQGCCCVRYDYKSFLIFVEFFSSIFLWSRASILNYL